MNDAIIFYAFRYALGRMTYAVSDVTTYIKNNTDKISDKNKRLIIREIKEADNQCRLGMDCDKKMWLELLDILEKEFKH